MSGRRWQSLIALVSLVSFAASPALALCASAGPTASVPASVLTSSAATLKAHKPACHCSACQSEHAQPSEFASDSPNDDGRGPSEPSPLAPKSGFPCGPTGCCWCNAAKAPCCPPVNDVVVHDTGPLVYSCAEAPDCYLSPFASLLTRPPRN